MRGGTVLAALLMGASSAAQAVDLSECLKIRDDAVRLFCYDRAAGRETPTAAPAEPATTPAADAEVEIDKEAAVVAPLPEPQPESDKSKDKPRIEARIVGEFEGWSRGTRFELDNGQVWESIGANSHYSKSDSPAVVIERDFFGQQLMAVEGIKSKAIVRRIDED